MKEGVRAELKVGKRVEVPGEENIRNLDMREGVTLDDTGEAKAGVGAMEEVTHLANGPDEVTCLQ